jgi:hypothetical protein
MRIKDWIAKTYRPLPETDGGADFDLVDLDPVWGKPTCAVHGAMNKVSPDGIWRCITTTGTKGKRCNAGCYEGPVPAP